MSALARPAGFDMSLFTIRAFVCVAAMGVVAACGSGSGTSGEPAGAVLVQLNIADDVDIDEVAWKVSGGGMQDMTGTIDTSAPGSTASLELFGLPEGSEYLVEMEALSAEGDFFCQGATDFEVMTGVATPVDVTLTCKRECSVLVCDDEDGECRTLDLPDGEGCAGGGGSCVSGACERSE